MCNPGSTFFRCPWVMHAKSTRSRRDVHAGREDQERSCGVVVVAWDSSGGPLMKRQGRTRCRLPVIQEGFDPGRVADSPGRPVDAQESLGWMIQID